MTTCYRIHLFGNKMKKKQCIIVIPVYNPAPKEMEKASFRQGLSVLGSHEIALVTHRECDLSLYKSIIKEYDCDVKIQYFDSKYFASVEGYNDLCFSIEFYERFIEYEYMLIYQLDAWVFRDELDYWCEKGYDYIGAPIFHAINTKLFTTKFCGIGNGGFCLRRISHCMKMIKGKQNKVFIKPIPLVALYWNYFLYSEKFKSFSMRMRILPTLILKMFGKYNNIRYYRTKHINEDMIFGTWSTKSWGYNGIIPDYHESMKFSFEVHPAMLFKQNSEKLPFGCHAFEKWEFDTFWSKYINKN